MRENEERGLTPCMYGTIEMSVKAFLGKYFHETSAQQTQSDTTTAPASLPTNSRKERWFTPTPGAIATVTEQSVVAFPLVEGPSDSTDTADSTDRAPQKLFHIFTDGACSDNGRKGARGGFGVHIYSERSSGLDLSEPLMTTEQQTNNRAELRGIQAALDIIGKHGSRWRQTYTEFWIWTDSEYCINSLTKWASGWKRNNWRKRDGNLIQNLDLIRPIYEQLTKMPRVSLHYVKAHQDKKANEFPYDGNCAADQLARLSTQIRP